MNYKTLFTAIGVLMASAVFLICVRNYGKSEHRRLNPPTSIVCYTQEGKVILQKSYVVVIHDRGTFQVYVNPEVYYADWHTPPSNVVTGSCVTGQ